MVPRNLSALQLIKIMTPEAPCHPTGASDTNRFRLSRPRHLNTIVPLTVIMMVRPNPASLTLVRRGFADGMYRRRKHFGTLIGLKSQIFEFKTDFRTHQPVFRSYRSPAAAHLGRDRREETSATHPASSVPSRGPCSSRSSALRQSLNSHVW
jgi:hypothetical protein